MKFKNIAFVALIACGTAPLFSMQGGQQPVRPEGFCEVSAKKVGDVIGDIEANKGTYTFATAAAVFGLPLAYKLAGAFSDYVVKPLVESAINHPITIAIPATLMAVYNRKKVTKGVTAARNWLASQIATQTPQ